MLAGVSVMVSGDGVTEGTDPLAESSVGGASGDAGVICRGTGAAAGRVGDAKALKPVTAPGENNAPDLPPATLSPGAGPGTITRWYSAIVYVTPLSVMGSCAGEGGKRMNTCPISGNARYGADSARMGGHPAPPVEGTPANPTKHTDLLQDGVKSSVGERGGERVAIKLRPELGDVGGVTRGVCEGVCDDPGASNGEQGLHAAGGGGYRCHGVIKRPHHHHVLREVLRAAGIQQDTP